MSPRVPRLRRALGALGTVVLALGAALCIASLAGFLRAVAQVLLP